MNAQQLLQEISDYCRSTGSRSPRSDGAPSMTVSSPRGCAMAAASPPTHSTASMASWRQIRHRGPVLSSLSDPIRDLHRRNRSANYRRLAAVRRPARAWSGRAGPATQFPLLRQPAEISAVCQYLQRKWEVAHRVSEELAHLHPRPPAFARLTPVSATARCSCG